MRALCGVPAGARLAGAARFVSLRTLSSTAPLVILVDAKARFRDVRHHAIVHFHHNGITDTDLFGIAVLCGEDFLFPDAESKLSRYAPKSWRSSHTHGLDCNGRPLLELYLRVQFHIDAATLGGIGSGARQLYVQHLRQEATQRSAFLTQAVRTRLEQAHGDHDFLQEACTIDQLNAHCYYLRANKRESEPGSVRLYIRACGLTVAPDTRPPAFFPWPSIGKISFDRKKFEIHAGESRVTLFCSADEKSKLLLGLCRDTHLFSMRSSVGTREEEHKCTSVISVTSSTKALAVMHDASQGQDESSNGQILIDDSTVTAPSETSGVYTMTSFAVPQSEDGSTPYGEMDEPNRISVVSDCTSFYNEESYVSSDSVDGNPPISQFRERADSVASAAGSFRGDGSDPTDRLHGPLTAEELTDLIVRRVDYPPLVPPPPATLLCDSADYLTLLRPSGPSYLPGHEDTAPSDDGYPDTNSCYSPPPPVPPKRIDSAKNQPSPLPSLPDVDTVDGNSQNIQHKLRPPPPYELPTRKGLSQGAQGLPLAHHGELSKSLKELRLGIPVREPPPYPGRMFPTNTTLGSTIRDVPLPPPPTVRNSKVAISQLEQYRRQLYSDVDYVIYPLQDPAISHQDYLDSKLLISCHRGGLCRGKSTQALSDTYIRLPECVTSSRREPPPPPFSRTVSDDNILNTFSPSKPRRLPPPPPPQPSYPKPRRPDPPEPIDIRTLREKSKNLDLPLIAALCNDKSLLKQTKAFIMPRNGISNKNNKSSSTGLGVGAKGRRGCHRHPGDALPDLPVSSPRATSNTYVPDPRSRPSAIT